MKPQLLCCLVLALCFSIARADVPESIKPYLSDQTVGIVRIDLARADYAGWMKTFIDSAAQAGLDADAVAEMRESNNEGTKMVEGLVKQLRDAGANELYIVGSFQLMDSPVLVIVPEVRDTAAVVRAMEPLELESKTVGSTVIAGASERNIEALIALPRAERADLLEALDRTGDAPVRLVIAPGKQLRDIFEQMAANLPAEMGGDPITVLTRGAMSIEASLAADATIRLAIRSESPAAAEGLRRWLSARVMELQRELQIDFSSLIPEHQGDTLKLTLDAERRLTLAKAVIPSMLHARETARRVQSASNIRQQVLCLMMWSTERQNEWPGTLKAAVDMYAGGSDAVLTNPRSSDRPQPHYIYVRPGDPMNRLKNPAERLVIYEAHDDFGDGINVGFADGHVEFINDPARFNELLKEAQDNAAKE